MAKNIESKREKEKIMVSKMIALYCKDMHKVSGTDENGKPKYRGHKLEKVVLCQECAQLQEYARMRSDRCPFMETKTFCSNCRVHCYKPEMREKIRAVMRYSGPRMIFYHPITAIRHVIESKKEKKRLEKENEN